MLRFRELWGPRAEAREDQARLESILNQDAVDSLRLMQADPSPYNRRSFVRAVFAYVEGMSYLMRQNALLGSERFSPAELAMLKEESYSLDDKGRVITGTRRIGLRRTLRFSVEMFARHFDLKYRLDCTGNGWRMLGEAQAIRNRITHPKSGPALDINETETDTVVGAFQWFHGLVLEVYRRSGEAMQAARDQLGQEHRRRESAPARLLTRRRGPGASRRRSGTSRRASCLEPPENSPDVALRRCAASW